MLDHLGESLATHNVLSYALPEAHGKRNRNYLITLFCVRVSGIEHCGALG